MNTETNRPLKWVPSAYFAMGLSFVILNMVCVLMFKGLGIYHRLSLPAGLRTDDSVRKSAGEELKAVIGDFFTKKL